MNDATGTGRQQPSKVSATQPYVNGAAKSADPQQEQNTAPQANGLARKLLAVMRDVAYVQRDKRNPFHGYTYASETAIKRAVHDALVAHGVLFKLDGLDYTERPVVSAKGKEQMVMLMKFAYEFEDVDSGEKRSGTFFGSSIDGEDKGCYKAVTGAIKYILTSTFLIATGDDPESEEDHSDAPTDPDPRGLTVDIGPNRYGTKEAQKAVAERKIRETAPAKPAASEAKEPFDLNVAIARIIEYGQILSPDVYAEVLRECHVEDVRQLRSRNLCKQVWMAMESARRRAA